MRNILHFHHKYSSEFELMGMLALITSSAEMWVFWGLGQWVGEKYLTVCKLSWPQATDFYFCCRKVNQNILKTLMG